MDFAIDRVCCQPGNIYRDSFTILVLLVNSVPRVIIFYISIVSSVSIKINLFSP